jgi:hypothetical protein
MPYEEADRIAVALGAWLAREFGGPHLQNPEGYRIVDVKARFYMMKHLPVAMLAQDNHTLGFIVTPTNPNERTYARTPRFDVTYFTEDVKDEEQDSIYQKARPMIDRFVGWVGRWDREGGDRG